MRPIVEHLVEQGERAFANDEYEDAVEWYELACACTVPGEPQGETLLTSEVSMDVTRLAARRFYRLVELRAMVPWRSVHQAPARRGHMLGIMACRDRAVGSVRLETFQSVHRWRIHHGYAEIHVDGRDPRDPLKGQAQMFFEVLRWAAAFSSMSALTLLEDDVVLAKNALDYIATTAIDDDLAFVSWFSTEQSTIPRTPPVLSCFKARDYQFNQAITFPARTVHKLLESDALKNWPEKHSADRIYKDVFPDQLVGVHYPNLVQHVGGAESLVGNNAHGPRTSPSFPGEDFDAWTLRRR